LLDQIGKKHFNNIANTFNVNPTLAGGFFGKFYSFRARTIKNFDILCLKEQISTYPSKVTKE